ncbi:MAG: hypothetical protein AB7P02_31035 [Alphaproteobacteria bacterium]
MTGRKLLWETSNPSVLVVIPHYVGPPVGEKVKYGSTVEGAAADRARALSRTIAGLRESLGNNQARVERREVFVTKDGPEPRIDPSRSRLVFKPANTGLMASRVDIVVATVAGRHALDRVDVPKEWFSVEEMTLERLGGDPRMLGLACHDILAERADGSGWVCYVEDDIVVSDPWFLRKIAHVEAATEGEAVLLPNRFERRPSRTIDKLYVDGPVRPDFSAAWQDIAADPGLRFNHVGEPVTLERPSNPHAGCFFLTAGQFARWRAQPFFGDRDAGFIGPLESAATLGLMRTFRLYKPIRQNAAYLEVEHVNNRPWLGLRDDAED